MKGSHFMALSQGNSSDSSEVSINTLQSISATYKALVFNRFLIDRKINALTVTIKKDGLPINLSTGDIQLSLLSADTKEKNSDETKTGIKKGETNTSLSTALKDVGRT